MTTRQQYRLKALAERLAQRKLSDADWGYLEDCVRQIADGDPADEVFEVKRSRGQSDSKEVAHTRTRKALVQVFQLHGNPRFMKPNGKFNLAAACDLIAPRFGMKSSSLRIAAYRPQYQGIHGGITSEHIYLPPEKL